MESTWEDYKNILIVDSEYNFSQLFLTINVRSSRPEVFCKKGVLRSFAKFTGKHLCQSFLFIKVAEKATECVSKFIEERAVAVRDLLKSLFQSNLEYRYY